MSWLIFGLILVVVLFIVLGIHWNRTTNQVKWSLCKRQVISLFGFLVVIVGCIKTVPTGHTGIITTFGKVGDTTLEAGLHFLAPWQEVTNMDNRTQKEVIELSCFSSDIQEVQVTYTINYQINKANAQMIYKSIGTKYFETIVKPKALEAVKGVFAYYNAENLVASRATLSEKIENVLVDEMAAYNIEIVATSIENIDFTDAFTSAVEAKQVAAQNKLKALTEQEQLNAEAEAAAKRKVIEAQAKADADKIAANNEAEIVKIQADSAEYQGQKDATIMSRIGAELNRYPNLVNYYYVTGWDGKLPQTMLSDKMTPIIDLKNLPAASSTPEN